MKISGAALLCLAYIAGLFSTRIIALDGTTHWLKIIPLSLALVTMGIIAALLIPRFWRTAPQAKLWVLAGGIAALAVIHLQLSIPQPSTLDISHKLSQGNESEQIVTVKGTIKSLPNLTASQKLRFWLETSQFNELKSPASTNYSFVPVEGKIYVTVPLLQGTGLYPGQRVEVTGNLYHPSRALNPGGFDFRNYLARQGAYAALTGNRVIEEDSAPPPWGFWQLRRRIIRAQLRGLGSPEGQIISSMVLGRRAVDLPANIQEQFIKAGLAHVLAASGFHVSLLLGLVLSLTRRLPAKGQINLGILSLVIYICLTGFQPSVLRAALMGLGGLISLVTERKVKPLGSLLLAATILLIINPLWLGDLGFGLSFLATLGLIVMVPSLSKNLSCLPPTLASVIAVPIAAMVWTLPLSIHLFSVIAPYSILTNIIATPFIALISLVGMVSALAALIYPPLGTAIAWLLYYPTHGLLGIVELVNRLPGSTLAVGTISLNIMVIIYGLITLVWLLRRLQRWWWVIGLFALSVVIIPIVYSQSTLMQVTLLATNQEPVLVIQNQGKTILVNSGNNNTVKFALLPFLQRQGINKIDWAIALDMQKSALNDWHEVFANLPVTTVLYGNQPQPATLTETNTVAYQPLALGQTFTVDSLGVTLLSNNPEVLELKWEDQTWLILPRPQLSPEYQQAIATYFQQQPQSTLDVIVCPGNSLNFKWLASLPSPVILSSGKTLDPKLAALLEQQSVKLYSTARNGAIKWTPQEGFGQMIEAVDW